MCNREHKHPHLAEHSVCLPLDHLFPGARPHQQDLEDSINKESHITKTIATHIVTSNSMLNVPME